MNNVQNDNLDPKLFRFIDRDGISSEKITAPRYSYWKSVFRVFFKKKINIVMLVLLVVVLLAAFVLPNFWQYNPMENASNAEAYNKSPAEAMAMFGASPKWWLGTGALGNSIMYGIVASARTS